jgi:hypothetical protein
MRGWGVLVPCGTAMLVMTAPASADHKVYSPIVEDGVLEFEARGHRTVDSAKDKDDGQTHKYEIGYTFHDWWHTSLFGELNKEPQGNFTYDATAWENIFQLTPQGKYWMDVGLYFEYARSARGRGSPDELETKLLLEKDVDPLVLTANLVFNREIGSNSGKGVGFEYAARARYPWRREIQFGIEAFGEPGRLTGFGPVRNQEHVIGPVVLGKFNVSGMPGVLNYNVGYLFGLTPASAKGTVKWELEYEIPF